MKKMQNRRLSCNPVCKFQFCDAEFCVYDANCCHKQHNPFLYVPLSVTGWSIYLFILKCAHKMSVKQTMSRYSLNADKCVEVEIA